MHLDTAILTAAGPDQRELLLQRLIDDSGTSCTALAITLGEIAAAGIRRVALVVHPEDLSRYERALHRARPGLVVELIEQSEPTGYGGALLAARDFVDEAPFLHVVGDHLFVADRSAAGQTTCAAQVANIARERDCAVSAVQATRESLLGHFGTIGARPISGSPGLWTIKTVREKPTPTAAELELHAPGLRFGHYLCFFGIHVLTRSVLDLLDAQAKEPHSAAGTPPKIELTPVLDSLADRERYLAVEVDGSRFDIGARWGLLQAQISLGLNGPERDRVLTLITELLLERERRTPTDPTPAR